MPAPKIVLELIERFDLHKDQYRSGRFNETQLRRDFLDPFFEALGWDVSNKAGYAEAYRDVIHEDAIKVGGATKAPDYCFRIGGTRKFFVEAKKPGMNLKADPLPVYSLRCWPAKCLPHRHTTASSSTPASRTCATAKEHSTPTRVLRRSR